MKAVGLRLFLTPDVLANLVSAVADKFKHFVRIKNTRHAGQVYEVDLSILDAYDTGPLDVADSKPVLVTREMVGELFDLLGLFPREQRESHEIVSQLRHQIGEIWAYGGSPTPSWLGDPLRKIEKLLISLEDLLGSGLVASEGIPEEDIPF